MVSKFQFYLDGTLVQDPKGWEDLDTTIKRDYTLQGLLISQESQPEFYGDGYDYIKGVFDAHDFTASIEIEIRQTCDQKNYQQIFQGVIYVADCVFDLMRCSVKCKTVDDSFYAKINNNKSIQAQINVGRSKNNDGSQGSCCVIDPAAEIDCHLFDMFGNYNIANDNTAAKVFTVFEAFQFLIAFMTDGTVKFVSDDFEIGGQWEGVCVGIGEQIRLQTLAVNIAPTISFVELYTEVNKKFNIGFSIERINGYPTIRIEHIDYFYTQNSILTLSNASGATLQVDSSRLYAQVHLGSQTTDFTTGLGFPEGATFVGFQDETFHILGQSNIDRTLELNSSFIISSNVIIQVYANQVESYDSDVFFIQVDLSTNKAVKTNILNQTSPVYYQYNALLTNDKTTDRWLNGIPNSITKYLADATDLFRAEKTAIQSVGQDTAINVIFENDSTGLNYDPNNRYNPLSEKFTAAFAGTYTFNFNVLLGLIGSAGFICKISADIYQFSSSDIPLAGSQFNHVLSAYGWSGIKQISGTASHYASAGDYFFIQVITYNSTGGSFFYDPPNPPLFQNTTTASGLIDAFAFSIVIIGRLTRFLTELTVGSVLKDHLNVVIGVVASIIDNTHLVLTGFPSVVGTNMLFNVYFNYFVNVYPQSYFSCTAASNGLGIVKKYNPLDYKIKNYSFQYPITFGDFNTIKADPKKLITFTTNNGVSKTGWIDELKYFHHNKVASVKLVTN